MLIRLPIILILLSISFSLMANEDARYKKALELIKVTDSEKMMNQMIPQMKSMITKSLGQIKIDNSNKEIIDRFNEKLATIFENEMQWKNIEGDIVSIYTKVFTEEELDELVSFYKSALGQKILKKMPAVMQESMVVTQNQLKRIVPKIKA